MSEGGWWGGGRCRGRGCEVLGKKPAMQRRLRKGNIQSEHFVYPADIDRGRINTNALQHSLFILLSESSLIIRTNKTSFQQLKCFLWVSAQLQIFHRGALHGS